MTAVPHVPQVPGGRRATPGPHWLRWLWAGTTDGTSTTMLRKIMQVNVGAAGMVLTIAAYFAYYQWNGNPALVRTGWSQLPFALLAPLVWLLNGQGRTEAARWTVFGLVMGGTLAAIVGGMGTVLGAHTYFLLFAVLTVMFFPLAEWRLALLLAAVNGGIYLWLDRHGWPPHPSLLALPEATARALSVSLVAGCIGVAIALTAMSEWAADVNERRLLALADTDALTGLLNRGALMRRAHAELQRVRRDGQTLALAVLDLDHFKRINDGWGHEVGDAALCSFAAELRSGVRCYDVPGRLGGEEFVVLMPGVDQAQAMASIERLRDRLAAAPRQLGSAQVALTVSAGVALLGVGEGVEDLLRRADAALYQAKRAGRNRVLPA